MTQKEYFAAFEELTNGLLDLTRRKNSNYANSENAFANFDLIEKMTSGRVSRETGILARITDKVSRIANLLHGTQDMVGEALEGTIRDLAVYSIILLLCCQEKKVCG